MVLEGSDAGNLVYKGEGAGNIVLSGYNRSNLHFVGKLVAVTILISGVLGQLLDAQKLDLIDIDGAIHAYFNPQDCERLYEAETMKDYKLSFKPMMDEDQMSLHNTVYLESMSLHNTVYLESINQRFDYKAYFIDLDMKPLMKMVHYYELDQKIVSCYTQKEKMKYELPNLMNRNEYEIIDSHFNLVGNFRDEYVLSDGP
ncbi:hypothetical protein GIB67_008576 [Kingdonia uniflora]|uniref:Inositol-pentakisphosphate 2-kinase n=1 Tax=Kingdonia uniflora TaxID=39325 RepID=A0A7J7N3U3_9MAGN|nr:hypothetical protein GIB67_008576 [Kingdonia uniflora]